MDQVEKLRGLVRMITIDSPDNIQSLQIYDLQGRPQTLILFTNGGLHLEVSLRQLKMGIYIIQVVTDRTSRSSKIFIGR